MQNILFRIRHIHSQAGPAHITRHRLIISALDDASKNLRYRIFRLSNTQKKEEKNTHRRNKTVNYHNNTHTFHHKHYGRQWKRERTDYTAYECVTKLWSVCVFCFTPKVERFHIQLRQKRVFP